MKNFSNLLSQYSAIQDDLLDLGQDQFFDAISYDIQGYLSDMDEAEHDQDEQWINEIINNLDSQVKAFRLIREGVKKINYIYC